MDDILRFVSLVNWHFTFRLEHSEQLVVSVASHFTFLSRQASQLGSFLRCRYALFCALVPILPDEGNTELDGPGVVDSADGSESLSIMDPAVMGV
jgi:hypothetical protein